MTATSKSGARAGAGGRAEAFAADLDPDAPDYYQLLGVPYTATRAEITRAYRAEMKRIHPDRQRSERRAAADEEAKLLNRAYATLSQPLKRQTYDRTIRARLVQDEIMGRYVGGFSPGWAERADPTGARLRRDRTAGERREQAQADRQALVSLVIVFGGVTVAVIGLLILIGLLQSALAGLL